MCILPMECKFCYSSLFYVLLLWWILLIAVMMVFSIYIFCSETAVVTLWGDSAHMFDAVGLQEMSNDEPLFLCSLG